MKENVNVLPSCGVKAGDAVRSRPGRGEHEIASGHEPIRDIWNSQQVAAEVEPFNSRCAPQLLPEFAEPIALPEMIPIRPQRVHNRDEMSFIVQPVCVVEKQANSARQIHKRNDEGHPHASAIPASAGKPGSGGIRLERSRSVSARDRLRRQYSAASAGAMLRACSNAAAIASVLYGSNRIPPSPRTSGSELVAPASTTLEALMASRTGMPNPS